MVSGSVFFFVVSFAKSLATNSESNAVIDCDKGGWLDKGKADDCVVDTLLIANIADVKVFVKAEGAEDVDDDAVCSKRLTRGSIISLNFLDCWYAQIKTVTNITKIEANMANDIANSNIWSWDDCE